MPENDKKRREREAETMKERQAQIDHVIARGRRAMDSIDRLHAGKGDKTDEADSKNYNDDLDALDRYVPSGSKDEQRLRAAKQKLNEMYKRKVK